MSPYNNQVPTPNKLIQEFKHTRTLPLPSMSLGRLRPLSRMSLAWVSRVRCASCCWTAAVVALENVVCRCCVRHRRRRSCAGDCCWSCR